MTETRTPDTSYWEDWNDALGLPEGTLRSAKDYRERAAEILRDHPYMSGTVYDRCGQDTHWNANKILQRQKNTSMATGRVNGQFLQHGNKR